MKQLPYPYSRYSATEDGVVYSMIKRKPHKMKTYLDKDGYHRMSMNDDNKKKKGVILSKMVYQAFNGVVPDGLVVRHFDGDKNNNHIDNLVVGTVLENNLDKQRHGTQLRGEGIGVSKLTESDVLEIRAEAELTFNEMSTKYNVTPTNIRHIVFRRSWKHI